MLRVCRNCDGAINYGWLCVYCVRAMAGAFFAGVGVTLAGGVAWWLREMIAWLQ